MLALKTLRTHPDLDGVDIDDNWDAIKAAVETLQEQMALGAVYIVDALMDDSGLTLTLSNDNVIGPIPLTPTLPRPMGDWNTGVSYRAGDTATFPGGTLQVVTDHVATVLEDDIDDGKIRVFVSNGSDAQSLDHQRFQALGTVTGGSRIIGLYIVPQACELVAAKPVAGATASPITGGGTPFDIIIRKVTSAGVSSDLGTLTFSAGVPADIAAIDASFAQYDALVIYQSGGTGSTGGGDIAVTATLVPTV